MSDCGGILVACLAAPLLLTVLLVAGVGYLAIRGAGLVGDLALQGIEFAGKGLAAGVRTATQALSTAVTSLSQSASQGRQWANSLYESAQLGERLRVAAHGAYQSAVTALSAAGAGGSVANPSSRLESRHTPASTSASAFHPSTSSITSGAEALASAAKRPSLNQDLIPHDGQAIKQAAVEKLARAQAISRALDGEVPLQLVAARWYGSQLSSAQDALSAAEACLKAGEIERAAELASRAEAALTTAAHDAYQHLVKAERATIAATVGNTLEDLGYDVRVAAVKENVALVGRREHHTIAMVVRPGGQLEMEAAAHAEEANEGGAI